MTKAKGNGTPDPVDAAIAKTDPSAAQMEQLQITISSTGRQAAFVFPVDMTEAELFEVVGFFGTGLRNELIRRANAKNPASRIVIPTGPLPRPS